MAPVPAPARTVPMFSQLVDRQLDGLFAPSNLAAALGIGVLLGVVTAIYPAIIALRVHPTQVLAGRPGTESAASMRLRRVLTVVQIAAAMGLAGVSLAIAWQPPATPPPMAQDRRRQYCGPAPVLAGGG